MKIKRIKASILALCLCSLFFCQGCKANKEENDSVKNSDTVTMVASQNSADEKKTMEDDTAEQNAAEKKPSEDETTEDITANNEETKTETQIPPPEETTTETSETSIDSRVEAYLEEMTIEDKIAQMFIILPEAATGSDLVTVAGDATKEAIDNIPVGGFVYLEQNLQTPSQVSEMLSNVQKYSMDRIGLPMFTCIDEEGGTVARLNGNANFGLPYIGNMADIGTSGSVEEAYQVGQEIGSYLSNLGFNVDFAPVADVLTNPDNEVVKYRSFGSDPELVAQMASAVASGLQENHVLSTFKHFPGHGATEGDTHEGYAYTSKTLDELGSSELIPFQKGIEDGVDFIMVGHISLPNVIGDSLPASLSYKMITEVLRNQLNYQGIIITDAMNMGAIDQLYSPGDAAIKSIQSGTDIILMPSDFANAYQSVLSAVNNQTIPTDRIDKSVSRIIRAKLLWMDSQPLLN